MDREDAERLVRIEEGVSQLLARDIDQEKRLRSLEKEQWLHRGGLGVLTFIAAKIGLSHISIG